MYVYHEIIESLRHGWLHLCREAYHDVLVDDIVREVGNRAGGELEGVAGVVFKTFVFAGDGLSAHCDREYHLPGVTSCTCHGRVFHLRCPAQRSLGGLGELHFLVEGDDNLAVCRCAGRTVCRHCAHFYRSLAVVDELRRACDECRAERYAVVGRCGTAHGRGLVADPADVHFLLVVCIGRERECGVGPFLRTFDGD